MSRVHRKRLCKAVAAGFGSQASRVAGRGNNAPSRPLDAKDVIPDRPFDRHLDNPLLGAAAAGPLSLARWTALRDWIGRRPSPGPNGGVSYELGSFAEFRLWQQAAQYGYLPPLRWAEAVLGYRTLPGWSYTVPLFVAGQFVSQDHEATADLLDTARFRGIRVTFRESWTVPRPGVWSYRFTVTA